MDALISDINVSNNAALCKRGCLLLYEQMVSQILGSHTGSLVCFCCYGCCNVSTFVSSFFLFLFSPFSLYFVIEVSKTKWLIDKFDAHALSATRIYYYYLPSCNEKYLCCQRLNEDRTKILSLRDESINKNIFTIPE